MKAPRELLLESFRAAVAVADPLEIVPKHLPSPPPGRTVVVADATFAFDKTDFAGVYRSADEVHAMSLANLEGEYATVTNTAALLNF